MLNSLGEDNFGAIFGSDSKPKIVTKLAERGRLWRQVHGRGCYRIVDKFEPKGSLEKAERSEAVGGFYVLGIGCLLAGIVQLSIYFVTGLLLVTFYLIHNNTWLLSVWKCFKYILLKISV